jgi:murein DD-endopeptidase MepM/ murein hydrolase activator NlpD
MKKWTVMLIPHDRGSSWTLNLSGYQLWLVAGLLISLSFTSSFFYQRHRTFLQEVERLQQIRRDLESQCAKQVANMAPSGFSAQERIETERRIRAEYEARDAAIIARLSELKDMEDQARKMTGIAPKKLSREGDASAVGGGKGGGAGSLGDTAYDENELVVSSPSVIYGLSQPSADMIIQEINLRTASLRDLVADLKVRDGELAYVPSIWPSASRRRDISSGFGFRKDPYGLRISHHDGTDISAPYGSPVLATAKGVVVFSGYDGGGLGNLVKIDHGNGIETWYGHLETRHVRAGDRVIRKEVIGTLGSTGRSTGPHIHYEVHVNGRAVDAEKYLRD